MVYLAERDRQHSSWRSSLLGPVDEYALKGRDTGLRHGHVGREFLSLVAHHHIRVPPWHALAHDVVGRLGGHFSHGVGIKNNDQLRHEVALEFGINGYGLWIVGVRHGLLPVPPKPARGIPPPTCSCRRRRP